MPTPDARKRVFVVVLDGHMTDNAAGSIRHGLRMFRGVSNVYPVEAPPLPGEDIVEAIKANVMDEAYAEMTLLRQQRDELVSRVRAVQDAVTGGVPAQTHEQRDALDEAPYWRAKDYRDRPEAS